MSSDLLGIGVTGLLSSQRALTTVSHNIANVNTDGYSRQRAELATRDPQYTGAGFFGRGVDVANVRRITDQFLTTEIRGTTAAVREFDQFYKLASQIDNLIADPQGSISLAMQKFFNSVNEVSNNPASVPARQSMLTQAETLVDRFGFFDQRLTEQYTNVNTQLGQLTNEINGLASSIAALNRSIVDVSGNSSGQVANDLLDRREQALQRLSELVTVKSVDQDNGTVSVFIGTGQVLVNGYEYQEMDLTDSEFDSSRQEVGVTVGSNVVDVSNQITGGKLAGVLEYRDRILDPVRSAMGRIAIGLTEHFNAQHQLGMDLNGELGEDFFTVSGLAAPALAAAASSRNTTTTGVNFLITDSTDLTTSDYRLTYLGSDQYTLMRLSDNVVTNINASAGYPYTAAEVDGVTLTIDAAPTLRDSFLLRPAFAGIAAFDLAISDPAKIAAASPIRTLHGSGNTGSGVIDGGEVVDRATYVEDTYTIIMGDETAAVANGTVGTITDNGNDSTLQYQLRVNGVVVYTQSEAGAPLADLDSLAAAINGASDGNVALTGVRAYVDAAATTLYLANDPASSLPIAVTETLTTSAGTVEDGDTVTGYFGGVLTGSTAPTNDLAYSTAADSYIVVDGSDAVVTTGTYTDSATIAFNGMEVVISEEANLGDTFTVQPNLAGSADNRNALVLATLQTQRILGGGSTTLQDAHGELVSIVGTRTHQSLLNFNAQDALLSHSISARDAVSGVSLDEEAADLMKYQQTFQASAQVIVAADKLFEALLGMMR